MDANLKQVIDQLETFKNECGIASIAFIVVGNNGNMMTSNATTNQTRLAIMAGLTIVQSELVNQFHQMQNEMNMHGATKQ